MALSFYSCCIYVVYITHAWIYVYLDHAILFTSVLHYRHFHRNQWQRKSARSPTWIIDLYNIFNLQNDCLICNVRHLYSCICPAYIYTISHPICPCLIPTSYEFTLNDIPSPIYVTVISIYLHYSHKACKVNMASIYSLIQYAWQH
jgi:hypothetical protein